MGRRRSHSTRLAHERASIGDWHVDEACSALRNTCAATVAEMTSYNHTREQTLPMLFRDDDLAKLKQVRGMVRASSSGKFYAIQPGITLYIDFDDAQVPTIEHERLHIQPDRVAPLLTFIAEVKAIHDRFEEVKAVLRYLNRNATPGAIRYYWPTAMQLCPKTTAFQDLVEVPTRYSIPPKIGDWMQSLKDAAATVTGSLMLPATAAPRMHNKMWLTFNQIVVQPTIGARYTTDQMTYHI